MILERLNEFWNAQPDTLRPGYQKALLTKWVKLDAQGNLLGVADLSGDGTKVREGKRIEVPREQPRRASGVRARLVHDNGNYALGLLGEGDKPARVAESHRAYVELLRQAFETTHDPAFDVVRRWVEHVDTVESATSLGIEAKDDLWITVDGVDPTQSESAEAFWNLPSAEDAITMRCLVTGELGEVAPTMPYPIKGVPGGQVSGTMLVSVNFAAGESYGLDRALNSPISKAAAESICNALNRLLSSADHSYRVGETVYIYWLRSDPERDALRAIKEGKPVDVDPLVARYKEKRKQAKPDPRLPGHVIAAPREGQTPAKADPIDFIAISLTANASRIAVRDYHELTLPKLEEQIGGWFTRLSLVAPEGGNLRPTRLQNLAECLFRDRKDMPKATPVYLADAALKGVPIPDHLLTLAVKRNVVEGGPLVTNPKTPWLRYARISLIKAVLADKLPDLDLSKMITVNPQPQAYVCGRLLAVLDTIQYYALRDPKTKKANTNSTLVDKHYGSFSTSPNVSLAPLMSLATKAHLPKIRKASPGTCAALTERLEEVALLIDAELPPTFDYNQQGLFALGFYHQKAHDRAESRKARERGEDNPLSDLAEGNDFQTTEDEGDSE